MPMKLLGAHQEIIFLYFFLTKTFLANKKKVFMSMEEI